MTTPRSQLISIDDTPYYHCVSRCVRRAFLCGTDRDGNCFEHRRGWIVDRIKLLASVFSIDICAYAVMSNHYHLVLRIDTEQAKELTQTEVIERWQRLFSGPYIIRRHQKSPRTSPAELRVVDDIVAEWRERLSSISWFMKCLNENIARMANKEDQCTGHFWESRFKSQALLDDTAILSCMAYVDLNPIRAGMSDAPESSDYTSIQERLGLTPESSVPADKAISNREQYFQASTLLPFLGNQHIDNNPKHLPFSLLEYFELVDWTGRQVRNNKRGVISATLPPILQRLNIHTEQWLKASTGIEKYFGRAIGNSEKLKHYNQHRGTAWMHHQCDCQQLYHIADQPEPPQSTQSTHI